MRAAVDPARAPHRILERVHGFAEIVERGVVVLVDDDATMAGASVESCRFVVPEVSWGRLGSEIDMGSRLRRMRGRFHRWIQISTGPKQCADNYHDPPKFWIQSSPESPKHRRMRCRRLPDPRPTPKRAREPISIRKK